MTTLAEHSETRRRSDRDRIVTTGPAGHTWFTGYWPPLRRGSDAEANDGLASN